MVSHTGSTGPFTQQQRNATDSQGFSAAQFRLTVTWLSPVKAAVSSHKQDSSPQKHTSAAGILGSQAWRASG